MDGGFANAKLTAASKFDMENSIVLKAIAVSIEVNVATVNRDVVKVEGCTFRQPTHNRFGNSIIECCRALNANIFIIIIDRNLIVCKVSVRLSICLSLLSAKDSVLLAVVGRFVEVTIASSKE